MDPDTTPEGAATRVLDAALMHVPFEGWSDTTLRVAASDAGVALGLARALFPRGGVDLALGYHRRGDQLMRDRLAKTDLDAMRYSERVSTAIRFRLEAVDDREAVRRATTLFALPTNAADGARAVWATADAIWTALGDPSTDVNWYTKRATLSGVYSATVLYWLGDDSPGYTATWDFLDRRIDDVMRIEKVKAKLRENPLSKALLAGPMKMMEKVRMPKSPDDLPGRTS
jgi:ubiquinone biosynthesis protein COQ9